MREEIRGRTQRVEVRCAELGESTGRVGPTSEK